MGALGLLSSLLSFVPKLPVTAASFADGLLKSLILRRDGGTVSFGFAGFRTLFGTVVAGWATWPDTVLFRSPMPLLMVELLLKGGPSVSSDSGLLLDFDLIVLDRIFGGPSVLMFKTPCIVRCRRSGAKGGCCDCIEVDLSDSPSCLVTLSTSIPPGFVGVSILENSNPPPTPTGVTMFFDPLNFSNKANPPKLFFTSPLTLFFDTLNGSFCDGIELAA